MATSAIAGVVSEGRGYLSALLFQRVSFCAGCGTQLPAGAQFCTSCGRKVDGPAAPPSARGGAQAPLPASAPSSDLPWSTDPILLKNPPIASPGDLPFHLQENERVIRVIAPNPKILQRMTLSYLLLALLPILLFGLAFFLPLAIVAGGWVALTGGILLLIVLAVAYGLSYWAASLTYHKLRYWITDRRTIGRRGVIGFTIDSMPYENIADVIVSRQLADRIFGLASLYIQPFGGAGYVSPRGGSAFSGSNMLLGLLPADASELQQLIFHLRELRRSYSGWGR